MSAKHILATTSTSYQFTEEEKFFTVFSICDGFRITFNPEFDYYDNFTLRINIGNILRYKDIDNMAGNEYTHEFSIHNIEENTNIRFYDNGKNDLCFSPELLKLIVDHRSHEKYDEDGWIDIPFTDITRRIDEDGDLFYTSFSNNEITRPLNELKKLIEKGNEISSDEIESISSLINRVDTLMKEGGIHSETVHIEVICRNLIRDASNITKLPDYSKKEINPTFLSIHSSIINNDSVIESMSFERLYQQLRSPNTYNKTGTSVHDNLFI